jgi:hypothetical protein
MAVGRMICTPLDPLVIAACRTASHMENNCFLYLEDLIRCMASFHAIFRNNLINRNYSLIATNIKIIVITVSFTNLLNRDPSICFVILLHFTEDYQKLINYFIFVSFPCFTFISGFHCNSAKQYYITEKKNSHENLKTFRIKKSM